MELPRVIDRYELQSVLGSGGFATVYRAQHVHTRQPVAVKLLADGPNTNQDRWLAEARAAATVQHRNVVRVLDCGRAGNEVFIVMDLAEGPTLADVLAHEGTLSPQRAVSIALQLLDGLAAAHACGIVHRDVKPANVLLARDENGGDLPKILDFGVSKQMTSISNTIDGASMGTPGYMAPELFGGARHADARADIYAVAATLYEMLSGKLPFTGASSYEELVVQVATQRPAPLMGVAPGTPLALAMAVDRGLAKDRDARWSTAQEFGGALRAAIISPTSVPPSHAYAPTVNATDPALMKVPHVTSAPSTLRNGAPPVVHSVSTQRSSALFWVLVPVGTISVLAGAFFGLKYYQPSHDTSPPPIVVQAAPPTPIVANVTEVAPTTPPPAGAEIVPTIEAPNVTAPPPPRTNGAGVRFKFPAKIVGQARATAIDALAQRIAPQAERCRPDHGSQAVVARVQLFVQTEGTISIAKAASEPGDEGAAECLAALFKEAATPRTFNPGGGGIVTVEAKLEPR